MSKIKTREELKDIVALLKQQGKKIVTTNGVFDLFHPIHLYVLEEARRFGDILIVAINSDSSVKRIKGLNRPIIDEKGRASILAALSLVDYVIVFDEETPIETLSLIKPNIHVKGGDYKPEDIPEKETVEGDGGELKLIPLKEGISTSGIIKKIKEST